MKKFMLMLMGVASAGFLQASSISWTAAGGNASMGTGGYIFAICGTSADRTAAMGYLGADNLAGFLSWYDTLTPVASASSLGANSTVSLGKGQTLANGTLNAAAFGVAPDVFLGSNPQSVFFVIFDSTAFDTSTALFHYSVSNIAGPTNLGATGSTAFSITWANWGGSGVSGSTMWQDIHGVPEPTAMALVALGAAAVGLRRRFRK